MYWFRQNQIDLKKKILWINIKNINRLNKKINIEFLQKIFSKKKESKHVYLLVNSDNKNIMFNVEFAGIKKNNMYSKYHDILSKIDHNGI